MRYRRRRNVRGSKLNPKQKNQVKRLIRGVQEQKFFAAGVTGTADTAGAMATILAPAQGITDTNRSGDEIRIHRCQIKLQLIKGLTATTAYEYVRFVVFQWKPNTNNLVPTANQLFLTDPTTGTVTYRSFYSVDTQHQYRILYDKVFVMNGLPLDLTHQWSKFVNIHVPLKKAAKNVQFYNAGVTGENTLWYYIIGVNALGATNVPTFNFTSFVWYTDS